MYTVNDFFCGCGGLGLGFQKAGFHIAGAWDFDKYAVESYRANVGGHVKQADIMEMKIDVIPAADVWALGFPCQDLSIAGKQSGIIIECKSCGESWKVEYGTYTSENRCPICNNNEHKAASRSGMFFEIMRLLDEAGNSEKRPRIIMAENVKRLQPLIPMLIAEYAKRGYKVYYKLFNSKYWNVPQNRERYFVVGVDEGIKSEYVFPIEKRDYIPRLSSILEAHVDEKYYISDDKARPLINEALQKLKSLGECHAVLTPDRVNKRQNGRRSKGDEEDMFTLVTQEIHGIICKETGLVDPNGISRAVRVGGGSDLSKKHNHKHVLLKPNDDFNKNTGSRMKIIRLAYLEGREQRDIVHSAAGIAGSLMATDHKDPKLIFEISGGGAWKQQHIKIFDYSCYRVRKLTPKEYGRLQGFDMDKWKQVVSDTQAYKQFGNAVTVTVARTLGTSIMSFLDNVDG